MTLRTCLLAIAAMLALGGSAAAEPDARPPISEITDRQAPQRFLDAYREGDEETMRAIGEAKHLDAYLIAESLFHAHLGAVLADPPAPRDYLAAAVELAERAAGNPLRAGLTGLVAAWGRLDGAELQRALRLARASHLASAALRKRDYERVLRIAADRTADIEGDATSVAGATLRYLAGLALQRTSRFDEAADVFGQVRVASERLGWRRRIGDCLLHTSHCAAGQGDYRLALDMAEQARALFRELGAAALELNCEHDLALTLMRAGDFRRAHELATRVRAAYAGTEARVSAAQMLVVLAASAGAMGDHRRAAGICEQAAKEFTALGDTRSATSAMTRMGISLSDAGQYAAALQAFDLAADALGDEEAPGLQASIALNRGVVHRRLGMLDDAVRFQQEALTHFLRAEDHVRAAQARMNIANIVFQQGELAAAAELWEELLDYWDDAGQVAEAAKAASNLSLVYRKLDRLDDAWRTATAALAGFRAIGNREFQAHAVRQLAEVELSRGNLSEARDLAERALAGFRDIGAANRLEVQAYRVLAGVCLEEGDPATAIETLERAVEIEQLLGRGLGEVTGLGLRNRARPTSDLGVVAAHRLAVAAPERAKEALAAAFGFAESGRGLLLAEHLANADVLLARHLPAELREVDALTRSDVEAARRSLVRQMGTSELDAGAIAKARETLDEAWTRRRRTVGRIQREARHVADLVYPRPTGLQEVRRHLGSDSALVVFHLTEKNAFALLVTRAGGRIEELGPSEEITDTARRYLRLVASPGSPEGVLARRLYEQLITPLEDALDGKTRLVICPDDVLAFLPWAALQTIEDGEAKRLVEHRETVLVPSATVFVAAAGDARVPRQNAALVALGDPAYPEGALFPPLPASADEVHHIGRFFPGQRRTVLLGTNATLAGLEEALGQVEDRLSAIHLACHAFVDDVNPRLSALVVAGGEMVDLDAVHSMRTPADLVVLSACASARGRIVRGEGPLGFVRGFLFSGARRVVASSWKVSDDSTRALMSRFYEALMREDLPPGAALRRAQVEMLHEGGRTAHPHHWAAFALWGPAE